MPWLEILVLAVIQGLTEFLPVSSSGHLVVTEALLQAAGRPPLPDNVQVNIVLHMGTLLAILVYYWRKIQALVAADRRVIGLLIVGTLPAIAVGLPLKLAAPGLLDDPLLAGVMFLATGGLLLWAGRIVPGGLHYRELSYRQVLLIGLFQAVAILPGISRSGSTIAAGLAVGLDRESSATFAFLLAIPAIAGAGVLEGLQLSQQPEAGISPWLLLLGAAISLLVGLAALSWLIAWIRRGKLAWFACWCLPLGIAVILWQMVG
jgi:undecaprenyl-diphosphatase